MSSNQILKIPSFHVERGEDYNLWRMHFPAACKFKNEWYVI